MTFSRQISFIGQLLCLAVITLSCSNHALADDQASTKVRSGKASHPVLGWVERIKIMPEELIFDAKLTPGSEGNVLHADDIEELKKGKDKWVRFSVADNQGKEQKLERRVIDKISFRTTSGLIEKRYIIELPICIEHVYLVLEVALANRSQFEHKMRIGRESLAGSFLVDPARTRTIPPDCKISKRKTK